MWMEKAEEILSTRLQNLVRNKLLSEESRTEQMIAVTDALIRLENLKIEKQQNEKFQQWEQSIQ